MQTPRMHIVSCKEYLLYLGLQAILRLALFLMGLTFFAGVALVDLVLGNFVLAETMGTRAIPFVAASGLLLMASLCFFLGTAGWEYFRQVYERQLPIQLLGTGTVEQLSGAESLLRASCEPHLWQEAVLLRAASCQEIPANQLLRTVIQEEGE